MYNPAMSKTAPSPQSSSRKARKSAARLAAVQAVYQMIENAQGAPAVIDEYIAHRLGQPVDGEDMVVPDGTHFREVVSGVAARRDDLEQILSSVLMKRQRASVEGVSAQNEPLLHSLLLCGSFELLAFHDTDAPIIISDYIHVTHAFFDQGEARLVNGVLDQVAKAVRDQES